MFVVALSTLAYNNGVARKPPLGWQTWCSAGPCGTDHCFDYQIKDTAKAMVDNGMKAAGYEWVILDDCWHPSRDANGTLRSLTTCCSMHTEKTCLKNSPML